MVPEDFSLMLTSDGKLNFTGKSVFENMFSRLMERDQTLESKFDSAPVNISHFSVGHDGLQLHALLVAEDGSVFFTKTSEGERMQTDHLSKLRKPPKGRDSLMQTYVWVKSPGCQGNFCSKPLKYFPWNQRRIIEVEDKSFLLFYCNFHTKALIRNAIKIVSIHNLVPCPVFDF